MRRGLGAVAAAVLALGAAACGDGGSGGGGSPAATTPPPGRTPAPAAGDALEGAGTDPVTAPATNTEVALLTDVRAARREGFDRVVLVFRNAVPGYDVRYVERPVRADGSGAVVPVRGAAVLQVRMENALDADLDAPGAPATYAGPRRIRPATGAVVELVRVAGFEGVLTWVVGVRGRAAFRVTPAEAPPRLVLDVRSS
jgi:hypothetical protein